MDLDIRWGFTTQNFVGHIPVSVDSAKKFIAYAKENGMQWIELRDPEASLTVDECRRIAEFAAARGIEVNYSAQRGLLADDFWPVFERAVVNTAVFEGPRTVRMLALRGEDAYGWTKEELDRMVMVANDALARSAKHGVGFTVENADTALDGAGHPYAGVVQLFEAMDPGITLQLDTANLFTGPVPLSPEDAEAFIRRFAARISYLHLKSARDGQPLPVLDGNPLSFEAILGMLAGTGPIYVAIELGPNENAEHVYAHMTESLRYLRESGLMP